MFVSEWVEGVLCYSTVSIFNEGIQLSVGGSYIWVDQFDSGSLVIHGSWDYIAYYGPVGGVNIMYLGTFPEVGIILPPLLDRNPLIDVYAVLGFVDPVSQESY